MNCTVKAPAGAGRRPYEHETLCGDSLIRPLRNGHILARFSKGSRMIPSCMIDRTVSDSVRIGFPMMDNRARKSIATIRIWCESIKRHKILTVLEYQMMKLTFNSYDWTTASNQTNCVVLYDWRMLQRIMHAPAARSCVSKLTDWLTDSHFDDLY